MWGLTPVSTLDVECGVWPRIQQAPDSTSVTLKCGGAKTTHLHDPVLYLGRSADDWERLLRDDRHFSLPGLPGDRPRPVPLGGVHPAADRAGVRRPRRLRRA